MLNTLRPFISRLISPLITAALAFLALKGINLGDDAAVHLTEYAVVVLIAGMQLLNGALHKGIDKKVNPGDAASSHLAAVEKVAAEGLKQ